MELKTPLPAVADEAGQNMAAVCRCFADAGLTAKQTAERMDVPADYVQGCLA